MDYEQLANAALLFVTGLLGWFGIRKGLRGPAEVPVEEPGKLKLDMAMVDNRPINALASTLETLNQTVKETNRLIATELRDREVDEAEKRGYERAQRELNR